VNDCNDKNKFSQSKYKSKYDSYYNIIQIMMIRYKYLKFPKSSSDDDRTAQDLKR
jgi:hypothetical protein